MKNIATCLRGTVLISIFLQKEQKKDHSRLKLLHLFRKTKIGDVSEIKINEFILYFSRLALSLHIEFINDAYKKYGISYKV